MIYKTSKNLTFVIYENQRPAKCFEIHKGLIKFLVFIFPLILLFALLAVLFVFTYHKHITMEGKKEEPLVIQKLRDEKLQVVKEKEELSNFNKELLKKMNQRASTGMTLPFISLPQGASDLTEKNQALIQDIRFTIDAEKRATIFFNIANNKGEENRLSGHVGVVLHNGPSMSIFPLPVEQEKGKPINYTFNLAESFSVSRFRPVEAKYQFTINNKYPLFFEVLIFSRSGDLLLRQILGPYQEEGEKNG